MGSTFELRTDLFESVEARPDFINPRCFGSDFAAWLRERLVERGIDVGDPIQEDFGWVLLASHRTFTFTISIGIMDDSIGRSPAEWCVGVSFERGMNGIRSFFRKAPVVEHAQVSEGVEQVLTAEPRIRELSRA